MKILKIGKDEKRFVIQNKFEPKFLIFQFNMNS